MNNENNVAAQAGDEPMREEFEVWAWQECWTRAEIMETRTEEGYSLLSLNDAWSVWKAATLAAQVSPRATADVERDELMMQCLFSIAAGHTYMDKQEILHCSICNADLDDGDEHSATCLTVRAGEYIATTKPGA